MKYTLSLLIALCLLACKNEATSNEEITKETPAEEVAAELPFKVVDYDGLEPYLTQYDNKVHVINFWATWCAPCIKELPYFEKVNEAYKDQGLEMLLVSLDFPRQYQSKLVPFMEKKNLKPKVIALDDVNQNRWIPAIDSTWSGAIPATIIYKNDQRKFYEQSFTYEELETEIKHFYN